MVVVLGSAPAIGKSKLVKEAITMLPTKASVLAVEKSKQKAGVRLRRLCLFGLAPSTVRALGQLLGRNFSLLVAKDEGELLSVARSAESLDGLVLDAEPSGLETAKLVQAVRSARAACSRESILPIFVFALADEDLIRSDMENLGLKGLFEKPGDIWKLAEAIHRELGPANGTIETEVFGMGPEAVISRAMKYIDQNLVNIRSSTDVSTHLGITREHLSRQFTKYTGQTLWDFITACRIQAAKQMLARKELLVKQISREVGFNCESSFFRAFTKKTGFTPEGFRKTLKE